MKLNALEDVDITRALYRASNAGVPVDLVVRDTCRLRPGVSGLAENVRVVSILGRFLEHGRMLYFANGGEPEIYIGSADCMKRNLEARVETLVPVEDPRHQQTLLELFEAQLADPVGAWDMQPDGSYRQRKPMPEDDGRHSQQALIDGAEKRHKDATRLRKRKPQGVARRPSR